MIACRLEKLHAQVEDLMLVGGGSPSHAPQRSAPRGVGVGVGVAREVANSRQDVLRNGLRVVGLADQFNKHRISVALDYGERVVDAENRA